MTYPRLPLLLGLVLLAPACPGENNTPGTSTSGDPTGGSTSTGPDVPTTTGSAATVDPTTTDPTTSTSTDPTTTTGDTDSTTGTPVTPCTSYAEEFACKNADGCKWSGVVEYTYGAQGCQGSISMFCIDTQPSGAASAWYRGEGDKLEVVEFGYTPGALDPEWKQCDCDGPLACLCTSITEDCPDRQEEFCDFNITKLGCDNATFKGQPVCNWFEIDPEGPADDMCAVKLGYNKCLPATDVEKPCDKVKDYQPLPVALNCGEGNVQPPTYWKMSNDIVEIIESCGPVPIGWTRCEQADTPDQPDECSCQCL